MQDRSWYVFNVLTPVLELSSNLFRLTFIPQAPYSMSSHSNGPSTPTTDKFPEEVS